MDDYPKKMIALKITLNDQRRNLYKNRHAKGAPAHMGLKIDLKINLKE